MRSSNPVLNANTFTRAETYAAPGSGTMTVQGAASKTLTLIGLSLLTALFTWWLFFSQATPQAGMQAVVPWLIGGIIGGLVFSIATCIKQDWAPVTAPLYALCEGLFLGAVSALFELRFPGIVISAVGLTFGVAICMLLLYKLRVLRATRGFALGVMAATGAIALVYIVSMLGRLIFHAPIPLIHEAGWVGIGFSGVVVVIAALNLVLDFGFIEQAAEEGAPQKLEWFAAFGLMVTLVWLYIEILVLLAKLRGRD
jgi:uncharacterized YccA/Bax inhibitor family protein